jgi:hypothetical protein
MALTEHWAHPAGCNYSPEIDACKDGPIQGMAGLLAVRPSQDGREDTPALNLSQAARRIGGWWNLRGCSGRA